MNPIFLIKNTLPKKITISADQIFFLKQEISELKKENSQHFQHYKKNKFYLFSILLDILICLIERVTVGFDANGTKYFLNKKGEFHRKYGPAIICGSLHKWFYNGKLHRSNGPAIENYGATFLQEWWIHGKRHREDGPALYSSYKQEWYINDVLKASLFHEIDFVQGDFKMTITSPFKNKKLNFVKFSNDKKKISK